MTTIEHHWAELVGAALLGTDRREPPKSPDGALADFDACNPQPTPSQRLLQQVATCAAVRRAGVVPAPPVPTMGAPEPDPRPITPHAASLTWRTVVGEWAVLEDEWVLSVVNSGYRLAPELVPLLLSRHRGDPVRHGRVVLAAGPLARWLIEWVPALACTRRSPHPPSPDVLVSLPELPITPEFAALLHDPASLGPRLAESLSAGRIGQPLRPVVQNMLARMPASHLAEVADALDGVSNVSPSIGLAYALADLVRLRHRMLTELEPA